MTKKIDIFDLYRPFLRYFRTKRMHYFARHFGLTPQTRVLDVGGSEFNWSLLRYFPRLTILNLSVPRVRRNNVIWLVADGRYLPFKDGTFEVVHSNSVIEHLGDRYNQWLFARECRRVGERYYVQTPNKGFPIEPHFLTPFIHWFPRQLQRRLLRNVTVWGLVTRPTRCDCEDILREIHLLDEHELRLLFPGAEIWHERVLGLTKSLIAVKR